LPLFAFAGLAFLLAGAAVGGTISLVPAADTFVHSAYPDNNNGASASLFTGRSGQGGQMRALLRFAVPNGLTGRATASAAQLTLTLRGVGPDGTFANVASTLYFYRVSPWGEGTGSGVTSGTYTVGQPCTPGAASWNSPTCIGATWSFVLTGISMTTPAVVSGTAVASGAGVTAEVQSWIDSPASNNGLLLVSSTEASASTAAQRYYTRTAGTSAPTLAFNFSCKPGFAEAGPSCNACTPAALDACVTSAPGNACIDPGGASTYQCQCVDPDYRAGTDAQGNPVCVLNSFDIDDNHAYDPVTDGMLILRYLFGLRNPALTVNALAGNANRLPDAIEPYLDKIASLLDVDGDTHRDPLTDGLLIVRYMMGVRSPALTAGIVSSDAQRTGTAIDDYLAGKMP